VNGWRRISDFLALRHNTTLLLLALVLAGTGERLWANSFGWLVIAFVVRGLKEFGEPARKAFIIAQATPRLRARTYGAYYLIRDCTVTAGSLVGAGLWSISPQANFAAAAICELAGNAWFGWFIYRGSARASG
jgi:hypothetical protein